MDYLKLAKEQFLTLKEDRLDEDRHSLGAENEIEYNVDNNKFKIKVNGFWEKGTWFNWQATDDNNKIVASGTYGID